MHANETTDFSRVAWSLCQKFPPSYVGNCVMSGLDNIMNSNILDAPMVFKAQSFCMAVGGRYRAACYREIGADLRYLASGDKTTREACMFLKGDAAQKQCLSGIKT